MKLRVCVLSSLFVLLGCVGGRGTASCSLKFLSKDVAPHLPLDTRGPQSVDLQALCFSIQSWLREGDEDSNFWVFRVRQFSEWPGPFHWIAFLVEIVTNPLIHWIASPLSTENPFFFTEKGFVASTSRKSALINHVPVREAPRWRTGTWFAIPGSLYRGQKLENQENESLNEIIGVKKCLFWGPSWNHLNGLFGAFNSLPQY